MVQSKREVTILGAGLSGLAAAQRLGEHGWNTTVYEKNKYVGGHAYTHSIDGFSFDEGPHISFTRREAIKQRLAQAVNQQFLEQESIVYNLWRGQWIRHPAQYNLFGLPVDLVEKCLVDFVQARYEQKDSPVENYRDWLLNQFGRTFSEEFPFRYTRKYWTVEPELMSTDWVGPRIHPPKLEEILRGALAPNPVNYYYVSTFRYPEFGGFGSYVRAVSEGIEVQTGREVCSIDSRKSMVEFMDGSQTHYDLLISTLPLPEVIRMMKDVPANVRQAAEDLRFTSVVLVNVGVDRIEGFPDYHWMYFYDEDIVFSRGNFPHRLSPNNVPPGCGSVQVEVYHSAFHPLPSQDIFNRSIEQLQTIGILNKSDRILVAEEKRIHYANILFDHNRSRHLDTVLGYLHEQGILSCGRYGEWDYYWTDDSIASGWRAADQIVSV
jgi:protoporphyrinogen oxidase